jgi:hypothetical protein
LLTAGWAFVAGAQTQQPPYALLQQATLTGSGNTMTATQVPVVTTSGVVVYVNATIQFNVDANGNLTVATGFPQITAAPSTIVSNFKAGRYVGPSNILGGKAAIEIAGPGVTSGGATLWTLSVAPGADPNTYPSSGTWYVGPIANNPVAARVTKAGITSTTMSYGVATSQGTSVQGLDYPRWGENTLIGVSQVSNTITFYSYTYGSDASTPYSQITYTLAPGQ